jgi:hypothetical protein
LLLAAASGSEHEFHQQRSDPESMQHGLEGRPALSAVAAEPRRGRRDDCYGRYASTTRDTRMESVLAAKGGNTMVRKVIIALAAVAFVGAVAASTTADAQRGMGGGFRGGGGAAAVGGGFRGGMAGGGFRGGMAGGGFRAAAIGGGFRGGMVGGGFRGAAFRPAVVGGGFRGPAFRGGFVGARSFAFRPGFVPRVNRFAFARFHNRFAFARFNRFHHRRFFAFAAAPFVAGVGLYGASCWSWQPTPWGWQRVWACDDYGYY